MVATRSRSRSTPPSTGSEPVRVGGTADLVVDDIEVVPDAPRRWTTAAWFVLLAVIAGLSAWSARTTDLGVPTRAVAATGAMSAPDRCTLLDGVDAGGSVAGVPLAGLHADGRAPGACASGRDPGLAVAVADPGAVPSLPGSALAGATTVELGTVAHPSLRVELLRASSPLAVADVVRVSDGSRAVSVATVWSSVDPIDGSGPGAPDVDGAVALAERLLAT